MKSHPEEAIQMWDRAERKPSHTSSVVDASFEQRAVLLQQAKLFQTEKCVIKSVGFSWPPRPCRHGHCSQVQIVSNRRLQFMVHRAFSEASRQVLA